MSEPLVITTERVDDVPLLISQMRRMDLPDRVEHSFHQHGTWQGLSLGWVTTVWLAHRRSEADHRRTHVRPWAERRLSAVQAGTPRPVRGLALTDDRLARGLRTLSDAAHWVRVARALARTRRRVDDRRPARVRVDRTTASGDGRVTDDGRFPFGHRQDRRPDRPQLTVMRATRDPLGRPVAAAVVAGNRADDPRSLPAIARVRRCLNQRGLRSVGECTMARLATRAGVACHRDDSRCPVPVVHLPPAALAAEVAAVSRGDQPAPRSARVPATGTPAPLADGVERTVGLRRTPATWPISWAERRLVGRSLALARTAEPALRQRVARAQAAVADRTARRRGQRRPADGAAVQPAVDAILSRHPVTEGRPVTVPEPVQDRPVRGDRGQPSRVEPTLRVSVTVAVDAAALARASERTGGRVDATTQPAEPVSLAHAGLADRDA